jgi:hypothetical protein
MKVYFNGYPNHWLSPYTVIDYVFFWTEWSRCHRDRGIVEDQDFVDRPAWAESWADRLAPACELLQRIRKIVNPTVRFVKIDRYDTWSMDSTLAHIIHPMLLQLRDTKHGSPNVDDADVPKHLRRYVAKPAGHDTDEFWHDRWTWVLNEMIWSFKQLLRDDDESEFFDHSESNSIKDFNESMKKMKVDWAGLTAHQERKQNGFRLFGKYFQALWD